MRTALLAAFLLVAASPAAAAPERPVGQSSYAPGRGSHSLSLWGVLDPGPIDGVGVGGRFTLPIEPNGILNHPRVKDEFTLELGADFVHYNDRVRAFGFPDLNYSWNGVLLVAGGTWNFWFTPKLALYPKIDVGYFFGWYSNEDFGPYGRYDFDGIFIQGAAGLIYRFQTMSLRMELGSGLLRIGVGFPF
jgi:hypothetical protein